MAFGIAVFVFGYIAFSDLVIGPWTTIERGGNLPRSGLIVAFGVVMIIGAVLGLLRDVGWIPMAVIVRTRSRVSVLFTAFLRWPMTGPVESVVSLGSARVRPGEVPTLPWVPDRERHRWHITLEAKVTHWYEGVALPGGLRDRWTAKLESIGVETR